MNEKQLLQKVVATTHAPVQDIAEYLKAICQRARLLPQMELLRTSGESQFRESKEPGETIAADIFHALIMQEALASAFDEINDLAHDLMITPNDPHGWQKLFKKVDQLAMRQIRQ